LAIQADLRRRTPARNMDYLRREVERAARAEPLDLVVLPEYFTGTTSENGETQPAAQPRQFVGELAKAVRAHVVGGSAEHHTDEGQRFNTCFVADRSGQIIGEYHKRLLYGPEQNRVEPGSEPFHFWLDGVPVGVLICADLWDPIIARDLASRVEMFAVPAHSGVPASENTEYARMLWHSMAVARATENALVVVISDWCRSEHGKHHTSGGASIVDPSLRPDAKALQKRLADGQPGILTATIDLHRLREFRRYRQSMGMLPAWPIPPEP
jgi:predicted amidohydrolase